jgi:dUTP pyrophosphatase
MKLRIKKLDPAAILPEYQTPGAGCFDLHALMGDECWVVTPDTPMVVRTGLAFQVPDGWAMMIYSRSGHGFKHDVRLANCVGVIDSDYRGEVMVKLTSDKGSLEVRRGDRIAQAMLVQTYRVHLVEVDELSGTERGAGGLGSTGT